MAPKEAKLVHTNHGSTNGYTGPTTDVVYWKYHEVQIEFVADYRTYNPEKDWKLVATFSCHDVLALMTDGLVWTTANIVPQLGYINRTPVHVSEVHGRTLIRHFLPLPGFSETEGHMFKYQRVWGLREDPSQDCLHSRWYAWFQLFAHSLQEVVDFRLDDLQRSHVRICTAFNNDGQSVFSYGPGVATPKYNCFDDHLLPSEGSWWFFPMEKSNLGSWWLWPSEDSEMPDGEDEAAEYTFSL